MIRCPIFAIVAFLLLTFASYCQVLVQQTYSNIAATVAEPGISMANVGAVYHQLFWFPSVGVSSCTVALDSSADGITWSAGGVISGQTCTSTSSSILATNTSANFVRVNVTALSGGTVTITYKNYSQPPQSTRSFTFLVASPDVGLNLIGSGTIYHRITWSPVTGTVSTCTVALDSSSDGSTWSAGGVIAGQTCTSAGFSSVVNTTVNYVRINVTALTGGGSVNVTYNGFTTNPAGTGGVNTASTSQVATYNTTTTIAGSGNFTYSASSGITLAQGANNTDALVISRNTDTSPTGTFLNLKSAGGTTQFKIDVGGNVTAAGSTLAAGACYTLTGATSGTVTLCPSAVAGGSWTFPNVTDTVVGVNSAATLSGKIIDTSNINVIRFGGLSVPTPSAGGCLQANGSLTALSWSSCVGTGTSGSGTPLTIPLWGSSTTLGNSNITEVAGTSDTAGKNMLMKGPIPYADVSAYGASPGASASTNLAAFQAAAAAVGTSGTVLIPCNAVSSTYQISATWQIVGAITVQGGGPSHNLGQGSNVVPCVQIQLSQASSFFNSPASLSSCSTATCPSATVVADSGPGTIINGTSSTLEYTLYDPYQNTETVPSSQLSFTISTSAATNTNAVFINGPGPQMTRTRLWRVYGCTGASCTLVLQNQDATTTVACEGQTVYPTAAPTLINGYEPNGCTVNDGLLIKTFQAASTGNYTIANGTYSVSGTALTANTGTFTTGSSWNGLGIALGTVACTVSSVTDSTHLTLTANPCPGGTPSGSGNWIGPTVNQSSGSTFTTGTYWVQKHITLAGTDCIINSVSSTTVLFIQAVPCPGTNNPATSGAWTALTAPTSASTSGVESGSVTIEIAGNATDYSKGIDGGPIIRDINISAPTGAGNRGGGGILIHAASRTLLQNVSVGNPNFVQHGAFGIRQEGWSGSYTLSGTGSNGQVGTSVTSRVATDQARFINGSVYQAWHDIEIFGPGAMIASDLDLYAPGQIREGTTQIVNSTTCSGKASLGPGPSVTSTANTGWAEDNVPIMVEVTGGNGPQFSPIHYDFGGNDCNIGWLGTSTIYFSGPGGLSWGRTEGGNNTLTGTIGTNNFFMTMYFLDGANGMNITDSITSATTTTGAFLANGVVSNNIAFTNPTSAAPTRPQLFLDKSGKPGQNILTACGWFAGAGACERQDGSTPAQGGSLIVNAGPAWAGGIGGGSTNQMTLTGAGTGPAFVPATGTNPASFQFTVGTTPGTSTTITFPVTATTGYTCAASDITTTSELVRQTGSTTTTCVLGFFNASGTATAPTASDKIQVQASWF